MAWMDISPMRIKSEILQLIVKGVPGDNPNCEMGLSGQLSRSHPRTQMVVRGGLFSQKAPITVGGSPRATAFLARPS